MNETSGIGTIYRQKLSKAISASKGGLTPQGVSKTLNVSRQEAGRLLSRWCTSGWLQKIKRGFYISIPVESSPNKLAIENPWLIVSKIFEPGYIGGFSAIKHWDLSEQIFETIVFFTAKKIRDRSPNYPGLKIQLKSIANYKLFGTKAVWMGSDKFLVSDPTKTIVDMLDDPALGGGMRVIQDFLESYLDSEYKNLPLFLEYAKKMKNSAIFKRLGYLLEVMNAADDKTLEQVRTNISSGYSKFDPATENSKIVRRWNLRIPSSWIKKHDRKK